MGNMLPSLFQARTNTALPSMNAQQHWSRSIELLARTLGRIMKRPCRVSREQLAASRETLAVRHATSRARRTHQKNGHQGCRRVVRVKVVLTRAEAARLLSLTEHGDKTAAQIVREFKRLQITSSANNDSPATMKAWRPVLASIPEEFP